MFIMIIIREQLILEFYLFIYYINLKNNFILFYFSLREMDLEVFILLEKQYFSIF